MELETEPRVQLQLPTSWRRSAAQTSKRRWRSRFGEAFSFPSSGHYRHRLDLQQIAVFIEDLDQSDQGRKLSERSCLLSAKCVTTGRNPPNANAERIARPETASRDHEADLRLPSRDDTSRLTTQLTFAATRANFSCPRNVRTRARVGEKITPPALTAIGHRHPGFVALLHHTPHHRSILCLMVSI
jgi:hypothetical protein